MPDFQNTLLQDPDSHPCNIKMHGSVIVGSKGQIVIPSDVRKMLEIEPGDSLFCITKDGKAIGLIPTENLKDFMEYMQKEIELMRTTVKNEVLS